MPNVEVVTLRYGTYFYSICFKQGLIGKLFRDMSTMNKYSVLLHYLSKYTCHKWS